MPIAQETKY